MSAWLNVHGLHFDEEGKPRHTRTSKAYEYTLHQFRAGLQSLRLDVDSPDIGTVALLAQAFAGGSTRPGKQVTRTTYNQRLACLSFFYTYAKKHGFVDANPIELVDRHKVQDYAHRQALDEETVQQALASIDQSDLPRETRLCYLVCALSDSMTRAGGGHPHMAQRQHQFKGQSNTYL